MSRPLDRRIGWAQEAQEIRMDARREHRVSEYNQPWWLPGDLRLTQRGIKVYEVAIGIAAVVVLICAMWTAAVLGNWVTGVEG